MRNKEEKTMKLSRTAALLTSAPAVALAWNHASEADFRQALDKDGPHLVACKFIDITMHFDSIHDLI